MPASPETHGVITYEDSSRRTDYLYRVSLKCLIRNDAGEVLVVKEAGRDWWDLPGGGMDHNEDIPTAIAREMKEEVNLEGEFDSQIIHVEKPALLKPQNFWQIRLIYELRPERMMFSPGDDGDEVAFMNPEKFKGSPLRTEQLIHEYSQLAHLC